MLYYEESSIKLIAETIGRSIKVNMMTKNVERDRYARACMEVDLSQPVVKKVWVEGHWHKVDYESFHLICRGCGCYGCYQRDCRVE